MSSKSRAPDARSELNESDSVDSLLAKLSSFEKMREANEIVKRYKRESKKIAELRKLLETAEEELKNKISRIVRQVMDRVDFTQLRIVVNIQNILKRRNALVKLLNDHRFRYEDFQ